jgi:hypothetical protein
VLPLVSLLPLLREAYHFLRYADGAYGWQGAMLFDVLKRRGPDAHIGLHTQAESQSGSGVAALWKHGWSVVGKSFAGGDTGVLCQRAMVNDDCVLYKSDGNAKCFLPKHWLVADHATRQLVITIRGTLSVSDALTDIVAGSVPFLQGAAHEGIATAAHKLYASLFSTSGMNIEKHLKFLTVRVSHPSALLLTLLSPL